MDTAPVDLVEQEQVEPPSGLLIPPQYQAFGPCVTSAAIRLDRDRLHIEEGQDGSAWAVVPPRAQPVQDQMRMAVPEPISLCLHGTYAQLQTNNLGVSLNAVS